MLADGSYVIFSDFDGTIIQQDSTDTMVRIYGSELNKQDELLFIEGKVSNRETMQRHFRTMRLPLEQYFGVLHSMTLDPTFKKFYNKMKPLGLTFSVLTGNTAEGVRLYLAKNGFNDVSVYGNKLQIENGAVVFISEDQVGETLCKKGSCAFCKAARLEGAKKLGKKVVYIGDGHTDICAAAHADLLFAKGVLAEWCEKNNTAFQRFESFEDIYRFFFGEE